MFYTSAKTETEIKNIHLVRTVFMIEKFPEVSSNELLLLVILCLARLMRLTSECLLVNGITP